MLTETTWLYRRCGYDQRVMRFNSNGTFDEGDGGCEQTWKMNGNLLEIYGPDCLTATLSKIGNKWMGRWLIYEKMPIELTPLVKKNFKISLLGTVKNRLHHLKATLPHVLQETKKMSNLEIIIVDYDSKEPFCGWLRENFFYSISQKKLKYLRVDNQPKWNWPHAGNIAARQASGDIIIRWDIDNYISREYLDWIEWTYSADVDTITYGRADCTGRISVLKKHFEAVGGYDENMIGWGYQDIDFINRVRMTGCRNMVFPPKFERFIGHGDQERGVVGSKGGDDTLHRAMSYCYRLAKIVNPNKYRGIDWGDPKRSATVTFEDISEIVGDWEHRIEKIKTILTITKDGIAKLKDGRKGYCFKHYDKVYIVWDLDKMDIWSITECLHWDRYEYRKDGLLQGINRDGQKILLSKVNKV